MDLRTVKRRLSFSSSDDEPSNKRMAIDCTEELQKITQARLDREWNAALLITDDLVFLPHSCSTPKPDLSVVFVGDVSVSSWSIDGSKDVDSSGPVSSVSTWTHPTSSLASAETESNIGDYIETIDVDDTTISDDLIWTAKERPVEVSYTPPWTPTPEPIEFNWQPTSPPPIEATPEPVLQQQPRMVFPTILPLGQHTWDSLASVYRSEHIKFNVYFNPLIGQYILNPINDSNKYC